MDLIWIIEIKQVIATIILKITFYEVQGRKIEIFMGIFQIVSGFKKVI